MRGDVADIAAAQAIRVLSLRYFNPIGADPKMRTGQPLAWPTQALGKMIQAYEEGVPFVVTGTDYPTRDGSGIRDYIHVWDLAAAHVAALDRFDALPGPSTVINLGTGRGTTVRELLDAFNHVVQSPIEALDAGRRPGDTAGAYTRIDRAVRLLGWQPEYDITEGIRHSLQWAAIRDEILSGDAATPTTDQLSGTLIRPSVSVDRELSGPPRTVRLSIMKSSMSTASVLHRSTRWPKAPCALTLSYRFVIEDPKTQLNSDEPNR